MLVLHPEFLVRNAKKPFAAPCSEFLAVQERLAEVKRVIGMKRRPMSEDLR